jgi:uridylate kinase
MEKRVIVLSLGGSLIVPETMDLSFLRKFREVIKKNTKHYKFVIVCGGGSVARKYISALKEEGKSDYLQSLAGIAITRVNARFMAYFFGQDPEFGIHMT